MGYKAIIQGSYAMLKFIPTRSVVQIIIEADITQAQHIIDVLGTPNPASECPVGLVRLVEDSNEQLS